MNLRVLGWLKARGYIKDDAEGTSWVVTPEKLRARPASWPQADCCCAAADSRLADPQARRLATILAAAADRAGEPGT